MTSKFLPTEQPVIVADTGNHILTRQPVEDLIGGRVFLLRTGDTIRAFADMVPALEALTELEAEQ